MRKYSNLISSFTYLTCVALPLLLSFSSHLPAWGTVVKKASLASLVKQAHIIAHVRVGESWSPKIRGKQGEIYTYTRLTPLATWLGEVMSDELLLVQLGGQIGDLRLKVHGDTQLKTGDEVVLFLTSTRRHLPVACEQDLKPMQIVNLVSLAQGAFFIQGQANELGDLRRLSQDLDGLVFYTSTQKKLTLKSNSPQSMPQQLWTLKTFKQEVARLKKGQAQ
ncbi:MAG: hypothetical protein CMH49_10555 [Myxococcales bacterium]|nr:hypothetical protein [Myxococcales bacterium]